MPRLSKKFALLLVLAMLASMFVGMGTASAATTNTALAVPNVTVSRLDTTLNTITTKALGTIQIAETTVGAIGSMGYPVQVVVTLPSGSTFYQAPTAATFDRFVDCPAVVGNDTNQLLDADIQFVYGAANKYAFNIISKTNAAAGNRCFINLLFGDPANAADPSRVIIQAGAADYKVNITETTSVITSGDVINAHVVVGGTTAVALSTPTVTQGQNKGLGVIRMTENIMGALEPLDDSIWISLPRGVEVDSVSVACLGGFIAGDVHAAGAATYDIGGNSKQYFDVDFYSGTGARVDLPGIFDVALRVNITNEAAKGDIVATIGGTNIGITPATLVIGKYGEFGVTAECANPTNIYAGRVEAKIGDFVLKENVPATLIKDRTVNLTLPEGANWEVDDLGIPFNYPVPVVTKGYMQFYAGEPTVLDNGRTLSYTVKEQSTLVASNIEFRQGYVDVELDFVPGDLLVTFGGTAGAVADDSSKVSVKVATIVAPISLVGETPTPTTIIGKQSQDGCNFTITEAGVGAIMAKLSLFTYYANLQGGVWVPHNTSLLVRCPAGVYWAEVPEVSVTGDLKLYTAGIKLTADKTQLIIPISNSSVSTASTINVKNAKFTIDRTVPEGDMKLSVLGSAVDAYALFTTNNIIDEYDFYTIADEDVIAKVTTPALGVENKVAQFVIGQSKFTLEGVEMSMDVAPYIKDSRTFLPIAYVAQALGLSANNIIWDAENQTVTLIKGDKVLQLKIGSTTMLVNGAAVTLDAAPEINNSRTCLPVGLVAQAFGEVVSFDAATQTVTIQ